MLDQVDLAQHQGIPVSDIYDRQHLEIKRKQQNLRTAIIEGTDRDQIIACVKELIAITLEHFKSEESAVDTDTPCRFAMHRVAMIETSKVISNNLEHRRIRGAMELMRFFDAGVTYHLDIEDGTFERELGSE